MLIPKLIAGAKPRAEHDHSCAMQLFQDYPLTTWGDAELAEVASYLRGSASLKIPDAWRAVLPSEIPAL